MAAFWALAAGMTAVALAFILVPLLRPRAARGPSVEDANLDVLRGQRREIESDVAYGTLPADARDEALADLVARARADLAPAAPLPAPGTRRPWAAAAAVAVAVPALAFGMYLVVGTPEATAPAPASHAAGQARPTRRSSRWSKPSRARCASGPTTCAAGRCSRARSPPWAGSTRRWPPTSTWRSWRPTIRRSSPTTPTRSACTQGRSLAGRPYELVKRALAIDPHHPKSLALAGTAAFDAGDYPGAARYWSALAAEMPAGSEERGRVEGMLDEVRDKAAAAGKPLAPGATAVRDWSVAHARRRRPRRRARPAPRRPSVSGSVSVAAGIASKVDRAAALFIFARAVNGPRMPLAVIRGTAAELPREFTLDDSLAMAPTMKISGADAVRIEARISRSGNALPQSGDLVGVSDVVKPGARGLKIVIDKVVP